MNAILLSQHMKTMLSCRPSLCMRTSFFQFIDCIIRRLYNNVQESYTSSCILRIHLSSLYLDSEEAVCCELFYGAQYEKKVSCTIRSYRVYFYWREVLGLHSRKCIPGYQFTKMYIEMITILVNSNARGGLMTLHEMKKFVSVYADMKIPTLNRFSEFNVYY